MKYYLLLGILILVLLLTIIFLLLVMQKSKQVKSKRIQSGRRSKRNILNQAYGFFSRFWLSKKYIYHIRSRIEVMELSDHWTIEKKTMRFVLIALGITSLMFLFLLLLKAELYFLAIGALTLFIVHNQILEVLVEKIDNKLLLQFESFLEDVRHHFHEHGMIDEAIYDTIEVIDYEMSLHAHKMYEVLTAEDEELALQEYYDVIPNKYFKTFLALCFTVIKYGDQIVDGKSMFLMNLNYLKGEINMEYLKRRKIDYLFKSLSLIAILPIFSLPVIEKWAEANMPELSSCYQGAYGFIVQVILFLLVGISYQLICKMQSNREETAHFQDRFEKEVLRSRKISGFIAKSIGRNYSKSLRIKKMMKAVGIQSSVEVFYLKQYKWLIIGFIVTILVFSYGHEISKRNIHQRFDYNGSWNQPMNESESQEFSQLENKYIKIFLKEDPSYQDIEKRIQSDQQSLEKEGVTVLAQNVLGKIEKLNNETFKWWELILSMGIGFIFYQYPYLLLLFRRSILQMNMEDEVMQFQTIILMLMNIPRMSVEELLEWMGRFATIFKTSIEECINNFEQGDSEALENLKNEEAFMPFVRIVENLLSATDRLPIVQVFDELKIERSYYQEKRKQDNEMMIQKKGMMGRIIAFFPMSATMVLYLIYPFIKISIEQFMNYSNSIKNYI